MPPLPIISPDQCIAALRLFGYQIARQEGSHVRLVCTNRAPVTVPMHRGRDLKKGTLRAILRTTEISVEEFLTALGR